MKRVVCLLGTLVVCLIAGSAAAQPDPLSIVSMSPEGELASLDQANEIRVVFSEPMVTLGRIPTTVMAPWFTISPAVPGTFRWSGTTVLIFTPDPKRPLRFATDYLVTISTTATAVSGRRLRAPATFEFTTPTVKLRDTNWYRRGGTVDGRMVVILRFNQPVRPADILAATTAALDPHDWEPPGFTAEEQARLKTVDPQALDRFAAKVAATKAIASSSARVQLRLTTDWDTKRFPAKPEQVVLETTTAPAPESWIRLTVSSSVRSAAGTATPEDEQEYVIQGESAFFITGFSCNRECDGDSWNPIRLRSPVRASDFAAAVSATDITSGEQPVAKRPTPRPRDSFELDADAALTLEDAGFDVQPPDKKYAVSARSDLKSADGQMLGYTWLGIVDNWHSRAFTSFGDGHGVWEKDGGALLPFYARNLQNVTQWAARVPIASLMDAVVALGKNSLGAPPEPGVERKLGVKPDLIQSHGLDLSKALSANGTGLVWTAVREGTTIPRARRFNDTEAGRLRASLVQVTNLGITVKDSPQNTLIFVTRLDTGAPVPGAAVSIIQTNNNVFWRGTTAADGVAMAPNTTLRSDDNYWDVAFIVVAEKDGDLAYVGSDWNEGLRPWEFGTGLSLEEASPLLRGTVFSDRGVYRLGEEVHFKAILRHNAATGVQLLAQGTPVLMTLRDSQNRLIDERVVRINPWSTAEWTFTLPAEGSLGNYSVRAILESDRPKPKPANLRTALDQYRGDDYVPYEKTVHGSFLVAAYRRPDFRVDVTLSSATRLAGDQLKGVVTGRYLFGAPMGPRPITWRYTRAASWSAPDTILDKFGEDRWVFVGYPDREELPETGEIGKADTVLEKTGELTVTLDTKRDAGVPYAYALEGDVEDVSRQRIANRASLLVHPAPWYIGVRRPPYFLAQKEGLKTEVVAVGLNGQTQTGVPVEVTLTQVQWNSVRRAEGNGFYTWETERREVPAGKWQVTTSADPVPLTIPLQAGGYFLLEARGTTTDGRFAVTRTSFYVLGDGYTAWARHDHNRIDLVPERQTYKPGDTARIMIQSPWEQATALVTTEREGIRSHRQFALTSTQQSISVPITEDDIPNLFVSVVLVKGRSVAAAGGTAGGAAVDTSADSSDPGKPSFRMGYIELKVEDRTKRLTVNVTANQQEYRPASKATVLLDVKDHESRGVASEVTLWAVDYGVLSLTSYQTPDVLGSVYVRKGLQVLNADSRQRIVSRRVLTPKGETDGGGGGGEPGTGTMRKDFRVLAFWVGSVTTNADGRASVDVTLPESLTTYRIMAVAGDRASRFGSSSAEVRTNKPLTLKPTYPRFLAVGDSASFGAVVTSQLASAGNAVVTMRSLDPSFLELTAGTEQRVDVPAGGALEVRFQAVAKAIGRARVQMTVAIGDEKDAFEDVIPVEVLVSPETVATHGETSDATPTATERLTVPSGIVPGFGGLTVETASTAMVGLGEGARYLVEYPYGCAEQKGSRALALLLAADLGDAFSLPGLDTKTMRPVAQETLKELERFQCSNGGFAYWQGQCTSVSPYLTAYLLHVFKTAVDLKYDVDSGVRERAYTYLERQLGANNPVNEGWWPAFTAWQAFAIKVLAEGGRKPDSHLNRLYGYRDRMPVFALAYLSDAMRANGEATGTRQAELRRRMLNAILPEAASAHVEELNDPYLLWFWNSNVRSTAIVLNSLVKAGDTDAPIRQLVRWMMAVRKKGRWGNTQENAHAMEALIAYYRRFETVIPDFSAVVRLGQEEVARETFRGRSTDARTTQVPMTRVLASAPPGSDQPLTFSREGAGTLFYSARLRYASDQLFQQGLDTGIRIERRYEPYIENGTRPATTAYRAGDLVRVTLTFRLTKERRFVAVTDPLPAGFEPVESWFATTAQALALEQDRQSSSGDNSDDEGEWNRWWRSGGFDHVERHDDRVQMFATRLSEGMHVFTYIARATTAGTFRTAPAHAEEMYEPEVFGRTETTVIAIKQ